MQFIFQIITSFPCAHHYKKLKFTPIVDTLVSFLQSREFGVEVHERLTHPNTVKLHLTPIADRHQHAKAILSRPRVKIQDCAHAAAVLAGAEPQPDVARIEDSAGCAAPRVTTRESERPSGAASCARAARWEEEGGGCALPRWRIGATPAPGAPCYGCGRTVDSIG